MKTPSLSAARASDSDRIDSLDVIRGGALFIVIAVHTIGYGGRLGSAFDAWLMKGVELFIRGSIYPLFAILFGASFTLIASRHAARGAPFIAFFARRLLCLLVIFIVTFILAEGRMVLIRYAVLGFPLLFFRNVRASTTVAAAVIILSVAVALGDVSGSAARAGTLSTQLAPQAAIDGEQGTGAPGTARRSGMAVWRQSIRQESYFGAVKVRARGLLGEGTLWHAAEAQWWQYFGLMLLGGLIAKGTLLSDPARYRSTLQRAFIATLILGLASSLTLMTVARSVSPTPFTLDLVWRILHLVGEPLLGVAYAAAAIMLLTHPRARNWLLALAPVGRAALTNWVLHSFILTTVFYRYGLSQHGKLPPWQSMILAVMIFAGMIVTSRLWLKHFRYGPVEWLWRLGTYGRWVPLKLPVTKPDKQSATVHL